MLSLQSQRKERPPTPPLSLTQLFSTTQARFTPHGLLYVFNTKRNDSYEDLPVHCFAGKTYLEERLGPFKVRFGAQSFFQPHVAQAEEMYAWVMECLIKQIGVDKQAAALDLYAGVGSMSCYLASHFQQVIAIEKVPEACYYAHYNARLNGLEDRLSILCGQAEDLLDEAFMAKQTETKVVVCDPPRSGLHPSALQALIGLGPQYIVYISCHPATQARDYAQLAPSYHILADQPFDLFPHTPHVENVLVLGKK